VTDVATNQAFRPERPGRSRTDDRTMRDGRSFEVIDREECVRLLSGAVVGRMVFTDGALPAVVPVTFAVDGDAVVCRTTAGSRLARAADGAVLALEADHLDVARRAGWSVVVTGLAEVVTAEDEVRRVGELVQPWAPGDHDVVIRLRTTVLTGRRVERFELPGTDSVA